MKKEKEGGDAILLLWRAKDLTISIPVQKITIGKKKRKNAVNFSSAIQKKRLGRLSA